VHQRSGPRARTRGQGRFARRQRDAELRFSGVEIAVERVRLAERGARGHVSRMREDDIAEQRDRLTVIAAEC
jgi:hypothetical protein